MYKENLIENIDKIHTTKLGMERIKRNLSLEVDDVVLWCKKEIIAKDSIIVRKGKNYYIKNGSYIITVNLYSYTIITAHKLKI